MSDEILRLSGTTYNDLLGQWIQAINDFPEDNKTFRSIISTIPDRDDPIVTRDEPRKFTSVKTLLKKGLFSRLDRADGRHGPSRHFDY
jgi:hypothetical protein